MKTKIKNMLLIGIVTLIFCIGFLLYFGIGNTIQTAKAEEIEEVVEKTDEKPTLEEFLAGIEKEAEQYGYGDEFSTAIENLKTAVTTKQVTASTLVSMVLVLIVIAVMIGQKKKYKSLAEDIKKVKEYLEGQVGGLNNLVDETNANSRNSNKTKVEVQHVEKAIGHIATALGIFFQHIKQPDEWKEQEVREIAKAQREIDGMGEKTDENNSQ